MKKTILSLVMIILVIAGVTAATVAYFSDTATISANTFSTSTMDLMIDGDPDPNAYNWLDGFPNPYSPYTNLYPGYPNNGEHNWQVLDIKNVGSVEGNVTIQLNRTSSPDNALTNNLVVTIWYDSDNTGTWDLATTGTLAQFAGNTYTLGGFTGTPNDLGDLEGKMASVKIEWSIPASAGNDIQGTSVTLDAVFGLEQAH